MRHLLQAQLQRPDYARFQGRATVPAAPRATAHATYHGDMS
jgi:hypothetical protein